MVDETKHILKKPDAQSCTEIFYLYDQESIASLIKKLKIGDEIILHADGLPFTIGVEGIISKKYDLTAFQLATLLVNCSIPNIDIKINLLICNSATDFNNLNFARDLSASLSALGCENISVSGYPGYVTREEKSTKFHISDKYQTADESSGNKRVKAKHTKLEEAERTYRNGELIIARSKDHAVLPSDAYKSHSYLKKAIAQNKFAHEHQSNKQQRSIWAERTTNLKRSISTPDLTDTKQLSEKPKQKK